MATAWEKREWIVLKPILDACFIKNEWNINNVALCQLKYADAIIPMGYSLIMVQSEDIAHLLM